MSHALYAEMMTSTARNWPARSLANAYAAAGIEVPVSGDKLAIDSAPYRHEFFTARQRPIELRESSAQNGTLWEGVL